MMIINHTGQSRSGAAGHVVDQSGAPWTAKTLTAYSARPRIAELRCANGEFLGKQNRRKNLVARSIPKGCHCQRGPVLKEVNKTVSIGPTFNGGRDWPMAPISQDKSCYDPKQCLH